MERTLPTLMLAAACLVATPALAGPVEPPPGPVGPTMKTLDQVESRIPVQSLDGGSGATHMITRPGSYYLTGNIVGEAGKSGIEIWTGDVTIDLNGFELKGVPDAAHGIRVVHASMTNLEIRNGTIHSWPLTCVEAGVSANVQLRNLRVRASGKSGISAGWHPIVENCQSIGNAEWGIFCNDRATVTNCLSNGNGFDGFRAGNGSTFSNCTASSNGKDGFNLNSGCTMSDCASLGNTLLGVRLIDGCTVAGCSLSGNAGGGLEAAHAASVRGCTVSGSGGVGVNITGAGGLVAECVVRGSTGDGVRLNQMSTVLNCVLDFNRGTGAAGIRLSGQGNRAEGNSLCNNALGIDVDGTNNLVVRNSFTFNPTAVEAAPGNNVAQVVMTPGGGFTSTNPWANFAH